ncbi:hypothetical protein EPR50_G00204790 [Perca flavescens]|uniref:Uncharacterized protein n=1 Tax=Perca flavescens TaxID=8167 RepID=A0A484CB79_PERFV|nr:hypothetical protein EPR50_G00204790 [Perca flavescens]
MGASVGCTCASSPQVGSIEPLCSPPPLPSHAALAFSLKSLHLTKTLRMGIKYGMREAADDHRSPSSTEHEPWLNMDLRIRSGACGEQRQRSTKRMGENARVLA